MIVELVGGVLSNSLALIADAGHMLTDFASLILAWLAFRLARRPSDWKRTYGFDRFSILAAFVNGVVLFVLAAWIVVEAYHRLNEPGEILGGTMLLIAAIGLCVNILCFWILTRGDKTNLNVRAALLHVAGDLLGSVAALVAALVIIYSGWTPIDPILSVFVALIILKSAWQVVKESGHILLEGAPEGIDARDVKKVIQERISGVIKISHIHAWSITQERPMITMEAEIDSAYNSQDVKKEIKLLLKDQFHLEHSTIEIK